MMDNKVECSVTFSDLPWDTDYFGVTCAKATIHKPLKLVEWKDLKERFKGYQFVSIENRNSDPINAQLIGKHTTAFLADVNIQFKKKLDKTVEIEKCIEIHRELPVNDQVIQLAHFRFSKFDEDPELAKRGGDKLYQHWLINSFGKQDKHFALSKNDNREINGFLLHSYRDDACVIELIAVSNKAARGGIGTSLFRAVEHSAYERSCFEIRVGTQIRNIDAINFYQKVGCKQVGCHQVYHLWVM